MKKSMLFLSMISMVGIVTCEEFSAPAQEFFVLSKEQIENYRYQVMANICDLPQNEQEVLYFLECVSPRQYKINPLNISELKKSKEIAKAKECYWCIKLVNQITELESERADQAELKELKKILGKAQEAATGADGELLAKITQ